MYTSSIIYTILSALFSTDGRSSHFRVHFNVLQHFNIVCTAQRLCAVQTTDPATFTVRYLRLFVVPVFVYVCFFLLNVVYLLIYAKLGLVFRTTTNVKW